METPNNNVGRLTEKLMRVFWGDMAVGKLKAGEYNKVYQHIYKTLMSTQILFSVSDAEPETGGAREWINAMDALRDTCYYCGQPIGQEPSRRIDGSVAHELCLER